MILKNRLLQSPFRLLRNDILIPLLFTIAWLQPVFAEPLRIGRIFIDRKNVFDTAEHRDQFPYSTANKLHIVTKEKFIRSQLLFKEGDVFDVELLQESERLLRSHSIFRYVSIRPQEPLNGVIDVVVRTDDVWTLAVILSLGTAGGKNFYRAGVHEQNLLGKGRQAGAFIKQDIDRHVAGVTFGDPHFLGRRLNFFAGYGTDTKGKEWETSLEKPFYATTVRSSQGARVRFKDDEERLFEDGDEVATFQARRWNVRSFAAGALNPSLKRVRRVYAAHDFREKKFSKTEFPDRTLSMLLIGVEFKNVDFLKERGLNTFDRDEDVNTGWEWMAEAGPSLESIGATRDGVFGKMRIEKNSALCQRVYWLNRIQTEGSLEQGVVRDGTFKVSSFLTFVDWLPRNTAWLRAETELGKNLDEDHQLLLGGENGLRGYSVRQFSGSKRFLLNIENRRVLWYDLMDLVNIGWAVFGDTGVAWKEGESMTRRPLRSDVGAGLRLAPSRSTDPGLIRVDVAYALNETERSSRWVVNIGADFSFNLGEERKFDQ